MIESEYAKIVLRSRRRNRKNAAAFRAEMDITTKAEKIDALADSLTRMSREGGSSAFESDRMRRLLHEILGGDK